MQPFPIIPKIYLGAAGANTPWNGPWTCPPQFSTCTKDIYAPHCSWECWCSHSHPQEKDQVSTPSSCLELTAWVTCGMNLQGSSWQDSSQIRADPVTVDTSPWPVGALRDELTLLMSTEAAEPIAGAEMCQAAPRWEHTCSADCPSSLPCTSSALPIHKHLSGHHRLGCGHCSLLHRAGMNISQHTKKSSSIFPLYLIWTILFRGRASSNTGLTTGVPSGWCST